MENGTELKVPIEGGRLVIISVSKRGRVEIRGAGEIKAVLSLVVREKYAQFTEADCDKPNQKMTVLLEAPTVSPEMNITFGLGDWEQRGDRLGAPCLIVTPAVVPGGLELQSRFRGLLTELRIPA